MGNNFNTGSSDKDELVIFRMPWADQFEWDYRNDIHYLQKNKKADIKWNDKNQYWTMTKEHFRHLSICSSQSPGAGTTWRSQFWDDVPAY